MGVKQSRSKVDEGQKEASGKKRKREDDSVDGPSTPEKLHTPKKKNISSTSKYIYQKLFLDGEASDIIITALNKDWKLHKLYLKQSPYFSGMFSGSWKESEMEKINIEILDENITEESLKIAFGSLYKDYVFIKPVQIVGVLAAATLLQLDNLIQQCSQMMADTVCGEMVCDYLEASASYGLEETRRQCIKWLTNNLLVTQEFSFLADISINLMKDIVSSSELFVMQVEIDIYTLLKKWIFMMHNTQWSGDSKDLIKATDAYFKETLQGGSKFFLETEEGQKYLLVFAEIRWHHVINDLAALKMIEADRIVPMAWLEPMILYGWKRILHIEQGLDKGPKEDVSEEVFNQTCSRCGRVLKKSGEYCWRWVGYNYGIDLLLTLENRLLTVRRNTSTDTSPQAVSLQPHRNVCYRLTVSSLDEEGKEKATKTTGMRHVNLAPNEVDFHLMLDKTLEFPLVVSMNAMTLSPLPDLPIPRLQPLGT